MRRNGKVFRILVSIVVEVIKLIHFNVYCMMKGEKIPMASHGFWTRGFVLRRREVTVAFTIARHRFPDKKIYFCTYVSPREIDANTPKDVRECRSGESLFHEGTPGSFLFESCRGRGGGGFFP